MKRILFVIGIRRSGTSILREMLLKHTAISTILFEPHHLWAAVDLMHFQRLMKMPVVRGFVDKVIGDFNQAAESFGWLGAKFALNPGTKALEWIWLAKTFPTAKFVFITRNIEPTWKSVLKQDANSVRGIINKKAYELMFSGLVIGFNNFVKTHPETAVGIEFERLIKDPDTELNKIFSMLGIAKQIGFKQFMKKPEFGG